MEHISSSDYFSMNAELSGIDFDNSNNMISYQADVTTFDGQLDLLSQSHINPCSCIREVNGQVVIHGIEGEINNLDSLQNLESIRRNKKHTRNQNIELRQSYQSSRLG